MVSENKHEDVPDPRGCRDCTHPQCDRFDGPRSVECRAMAQTACARHEPRPGKHEALRAAAQAATPGPWTVFDPHCEQETFGIDGDDGTAVVHYGASVSEGIERHSDAQFIAAANPAAVLALLDERDALRAALDAAKTGLEWYWDLESIGRDGSDDEMAAQIDAALNWTALKESA